LSLVRGIKSQLLRAEFSLIGSCQRNAKQLHVSIARRCHIAEPFSIRRHAEPCHVLLAFEVKECRRASASQGDRVKGLLILFSKCLKDDLVGSPGPLGVGDLVRKTLQGNYPGRLRYGAGQLINTDEIKNMA
jgi:hypothetical protein